MKIILKNFRCYEEATFDFGVSGISLLSGPSGYGKSTILIAIQFVLYGTGTKIIKQGKNSCSVELHFDSLKIYRTKRPNRVIVNDIYEDDAAQGIINQKFGDTFSTTGYICQNALNSFILMSPTDKLLFFEKFAFKDTNLSDIKSKTKKYITDTNNILITTISQLDFAKNFFKELKEPEKVIFPIRCKNKDTVLKNEEIKKKNCNILIKRFEKKSNEIETELNDIRILNSCINSNLEKLSLLNENKKTLLIEEKENSFLGDEYLLEYKNRLAKLLSYKDMISIQNSFIQNSEKLSNMKEKEIENYNAQIQEINNTLWKEYNKDELETMITETKKCIEDIQKINMLENELGKYSNINIEQYKQHKAQLVSVRNDIENKKKILKCLEFQKELFSCPSCNKKLCFKNENLQLVDDDVLSDIDTNLNIDLLRNDINVLQKENTNLEKVITEYENNFDKSKNIKREIDVILSQYEERYNIKELQDDLDYLKEYSSSQKYKENKKTELEKKLKTEQFSLSYISFNKDVQKEQEMLNKLQTKLRDYKEHLTENEIRNFIYEQQKQKEMNTYILNKIKSINNEIENCNSKINDLRNIHINKYKCIKEEEELISIFQENKKNIKDTKHKLNNCFEILEKIEKYKKYEEEYNNYLSWKNKISELSLKETQDRNTYSSAMLLYEKILEAESIAIHNIILSVNTHAQLYLDNFFQENPISVRLQPFKDTKKTTKPQINIQIEYKGMECELNMLSGGELSRVILAYTLALGEMFNTPLLLLDECTSSLDQNLTTVVFNSIREMYNGKLVILIAHQVVSGIFDKIINLEN